MDMKQYPTGKIILTIAIPFYSGTAMLAETPGSIVSQGVPDAGVISN